MGTISDKLTYLQGTKSAIKNAIIAKGVSVETGTPFRDYATKIGEISGGGGTPPPVADEWVRPSEWLPLPDNIDGVEKVSILNAVFDTDSEYVSFVCEDKFTVDWGDGVVRNYDSKTKVQHKYDYNNANLNSDTVSKFGYKQCIITITPQSGYNLSRLTLNQSPTAISNTQAFKMTSGFLDIRINTIFIINSSRFGIGTVDLTSSLSYIKHTMLEQCLIGELGVTSLDNLFYDCYALQSVTIKDTSNVTSFNSMHCNNFSLQKMPLYTFRANDVIVSSMFYNCYSLIETYPLFITIASGTGNIMSMFEGCKSLKYIDLTINSNLNYSLSRIVHGCLSLEDIKLTQTGTGKVASLLFAFAYTRIKESPVIDTSLCTNFNYAFIGCDRLSKLQTYDYSNATSLANMLNNCYSLKSVPNFNTTSICTNLSSLCWNCQSLEKAPTFSDSSGVTNASNMLYSCKSITTVPTYTFGNLGSSGFGSIFNQMDSLQICPNITTAGFTGNATPLNGCYSLKRMLMPWEYTFTVANAKMSASALNEMFSILPTVTGKTVTITGNYGASTCDTSIATAKGWTVTK